MINRISSIAIVTFIFCACQSKMQNRSPLEQVQYYLNERVDSLRYFTEAMRTSIEENNIASARENFIQSRFQYKKMESVVEYYFPGVAKAVNGPAIDKAEEYDDKVIEASGFQVVEEKLFSGEEMDTTILLHEVDILRSTITRIEKLIETNTLSDSNVLEACRLQVVRIMSLGISGFDSPVAFNSLREAFHALNGLKSILSFYNRDGQAEVSFTTTANRFQKCLSYLDTHRDFNAFDRAEFIVEYLNPLSASIHQLQNGLGIPNNKWLSAIDMNKDNVFESGAFNIAFFAPTHNQTGRNELITLGNALFFDPLLSGNGSRSCASCHNPSHAFADARKQSVAFDFKGVISRNTPTLVNSGFQKSQFWDQRVQFLEDQITDVLSNPTEMHGNMQYAVDKIRASHDYVELFRAAFGDDTVKIVTPRNIQAALAWYIRSLEGLNSRFDEFMRGDRSKLSANEIKGMNLFMGKAKCGTCHFIPLFNGSVPPFFSETESEVLGVPKHPDTTAAVVDSDLGKFHTYNRELHKHSFKTPTVRNAALTSPYMHNGVYQTLEEVMDFYNKGGGVGIGIDLPNQTIPFDKLNLSTEEQEQVISFIHALTDTTGLTTIPKSLPKIEDKRLANRKVGGRY